MKVEPANFQQHILTYDFNVVQLSEFGLDPRDWLLRDSRTANYSTHRLHHRDEEDIQLMVHLGENGSIKEVELKIISNE